MVKMDVMNEKKAFENSEQMVCRSYLAAAIKGQEITIFEITKRKAKPCNPALNLQTINYKFVKLDFLVSIHRSESNLKDLD